MRQYTNGNQDIILGIIVFLLGFLAIATAWGPLSYVTAGVSWIAGIYMVLRGVGKNRKQQDEL